MTFEELYQEALTSAASPNEKTRYLSIKYLNQALSARRNGENPSENTLKFLIALAKTHNEEKLSEEDKEILGKVNSYDKISYSETYGKPYIRNHITEIWIKSIKFDLLMGELQNIQEKLSYSKEQLELMENIVQIASKYLPERTID